MCSMMPPAGTQVAASDTSDGIAVGFTTSGDVTDLRARVHHLADMHNGMSGMHHDGGMHEGMGSGGMHEGMGSGDMHGGMGSGGMHEGMGGDMHGGMNGMQMVPSRATVEDIAGGAQLVIVPSDAAQLSALRAHVREHAAMMQNGKCPMKGSQSAEPTNKHAHDPPAGG